MWDVPRDAATLAYAALSVFVLLWDVLLAGQIAQARRQARDFLALTALCGLFVAPAALIALAAPSAWTGGPVALVTWVWPATLALFTAQSLLAVTRRLVTSLISVPILAFNLLLFLAAAARYATTTWPGAPAALLGIEAAHTSVMGLVWNASALWSPIVVQLPLLAPAYPARWRVSKTLRATLAIGATAWSLLMLAEYPSGVRAVSTFAALTNEPLQERPRGDLALGVRILPDLRGPPPAAALARDLPLADSLGVRLLSVVVTPEGTSALALDSLAAALAPWRADSARLVVSLGYGRADRAAWLASPAAYRERRLTMVDRVMRRVRPDVLVPAAEPFELGPRLVGNVPLAWWMDYHTRAAKLAHELRPRTQVAASISAYTIADSMFYAWASRTAVIDLMALTFAPTFRGGGSIAARQRVVTRWMAGNRKPHWVIAVRAYPYVFGEAAQQSAMLGTFAWASRQPRVTAVVLDGAGDYDMLSGLQRADGGFRPALATLARARQALQESR
ncbi:MAG: hypothetical protein IT361_18875 [Gemmatimonadaceae bacterium]|nr:hypothetical protein [Gemmatimonadaceae bacterium]